jgi:hypothetical protein
MELKTIKERLEQNEDFKYWRDTRGVTFDDFKVIDVPNNKTISDGSTKIGEYCILILNDDEFKVISDL